MTARRKKPHVILLINDEHRPDVLSVEGNTIVRTPNLDRLLAEGTYFRNAYTPSPISVPTRFCSLPTTRSAVPSPFRSPTAREIGDVSRAISVTRA